MKIFSLSVFVFGFLYASAQYVGPPRNVGREYGNPKMPLLVSHLAGANRERLKRANKNSRHSVFSKILCFRRLCRIQSGHSASLRAISYEKFQRKIAKNGKKGLYKNLRPDSTHKVKRNEFPAQPVIKDTLDKKAVPSLPTIKADSLIILGAELLFETNKSTLRSEHFETLNPILDYLLSHPKRFVKISGHSDNTGREDHNVSLSKQRADVVAEYLIRNGVELGRVQSLGLGSSKPIEGNHTEDGRRKNRRVELLMYDGE
jgi:outer membrane protein OmpA-like peptidoglycan-associated protein